MIIFKWKFSEKIEASLQLNFSFSPQRKFKLFPVNPRIVFYSDSSTKTIIDVFINDDNMFGKGSVYSPKGQTLAVKLDDFYDQATGSHIFPLRFTVRALWTEEEADDDVEVETGASAVVETTEELPENLAEEFVIIDTHGQEKPADKSVNESIGVDDDASVTIDTYSEKDSAELIDADKIDDNNKEVLEDEDKDEVYDKARENARIHQVSLWRTYFSADRQFIVEERQPRDEEDRLAMEDNKKFRQFYGTSPTSWMHEVETEKTLAEKKLFSDALDEYVNIDNFYNTIRHSYYNNLVQIIDLVIKNFIVKQDFAKLSATKQWQLMKTNDVVYEHVVEKVLAKLLKKVTIVF